MSETLGCADSYAAELRTRDGRRRTAFLDGITKVDWTRVINGTSDATVTLAPRTKGCRTALDEAIPWAQELHLWRDTEPVWEGPLQRIVDDGTALSVQAADVSAWLGERLIHSEHDTEGELVPVTELAAQTIRSAFAPDDPNVLAHLWILEGGPAAERYVDADTVVAAADLDALVTLGLDWTVAGRRIVLFHAPEPLARTAPLIGDHFTAPLPLARIGPGTITRAIGQGAGVRGEAGGTHPVLGLLERIVDVGDVDSDEDAALAAAKALYTPMLMLAGDTAVPLTRRAPIPIRALVPGVVTRISGSGAALTIVGVDAQLTKLSVSWTPQGETVTPTYVELTDRTGEVV